MSTKEERSERCYLANFEDHAKPCKWRLEAKKCKEMYYPVEPLERDKDMLIPSFYTVRSKSDF